MRAAAVVRVADTAPFLSLLSLSSCEQIIKVRSEEADYLLKETSQGKRPARLNALLEHAGTTDSSVLGSFLGNRFISRLTTLGTAGGKRGPGSFASSIRSLGDSFRSTLGRPAAPAPRERSARLTTIAETTKSGSTLASRLARSRDGRSPRDDDSSNSGSSAVAHSILSSHARGQRPVRHNTSSSIASAISSAVSRRGRYGGPSGNALTLGQQERRKAASYAPNSWAVPGTSWTASFRRFERKPSLVPDRVAMGFNGSEREQRERRGRGGPLSGGSSSSDASSYGDPEDIVSHSTASTRSRARSILYVVRKHMRHRDEAVLREAGKQTRKRSNAVMRVARRGGELPPLQPAEVEGPWRRMSFLSPQEVSRLEEERERAALFGGAQLAAAAGGAFGGDMRTIGGVQRLYIPPPTVGFPAINESSNDGSVRGYSSSTGRAPRSTKGSTGSSTVQSTGRGRSNSPDTHPTDLHLLAPAPGSPPPMPPPMPPPAWMADDFAPEVTDISLIDLDLSGGPAERQARLEDSPQKAAQPQEAVPPLIWGGVAPSRIPQLRRAASDSRMQSIDEHEEESQVFQQQRRRARASAFGESALFDVEEESSSAPGEQSEALSGIERGGESGSAKEEEGASGRPLRPVAVDSPADLFGRLLPEPPRARTVPLVEVPRPAPQRVKRVVIRTPSEVSMMASLPLRQEQHEPGAPAHLAAPGTSAGGGSSREDVPRPDSPNFPPTAEASGLDVYTLEPERRQGARGRSLMSQFLRFDGSAQPQQASAGPPAGKRIPAERLRRLPSASAGAAAPGSAGTTSASALSSGSRMETLLGLATGEGGGASAASQPGRPARPQAGILRPRGASRVPPGTASEEPPQGETGPEAAE